MPPLITRVEWSAQDLPLGVTFNEANGTFSGTPEDVGEYVVPVIVQTNYGKDTKDVVIGVINKIGLYVKGTGVRTWSSNPVDENGFCKIDVSNVLKINPLFRGFIAQTSNGERYFEGTYDIEQFIVEKASSKYIIDGGFVINNTTSLPLLEDFDEVLYGTRFNLLYGTTSTSGSGTGRYTSSIYRLSKRGNKIYLKTSNILNYVNNGYQGDANIPLTVSTSGNITEVEIPYEGYSFGDNVSACAHNYYLYKDNNLLELDGDTVVSNVTLDKKIIKVFQKVYPFHGNTSLGKDYGLGVFSYLTEDNLLDNNPDNFTEGVIKDAWCVGSVACVVTMNNELYLRLPDVNNVDNFSWVFQGEYNNVKKVQLIDDSGSMHTKRRPSAFILTDDGKLYCYSYYAMKNNLVPSLRTLTQVFPDYYIKDFYCDYLNGSYDNYSPSLVILTE